MKKISKSLFFLIGVGVMGFLSADLSQTPSSTPINSDLSVYSPTVAPVTSITDTQEKSSKDDSDQIVQLKQTISALQNQIALQGHQLAELELRLQAVEIALGQSPHSQSASLDDQKKNSQTIVNNPNSVSNSANTDSADAQKLYKTAMQQIQAKDYTNSLTSLQAYVNQYPQGDSAADAQYWIGEIYAIQGDNDKARQQFLMLTKQYPQSDVAANAMLNLGTIAFSQLDYSNARDWFSKISQNYPDTPAAQSANNQLNMLKKAGY